MNSILRAPWTDEQVAALNRAQANPKIHPYTCMCDISAPLEATTHGWICRRCKYIQTWAWTASLRAAIEAEE